MIPAPLRIIGIVSLATMFALPHAWTQEDDDIPVPAEHEAADPEEEMRQLQDVVEIEGAMRIAEAENIYLEARALYQSASFVEAKDKVERALQIFPPHRGAQELREDILGILAVRSDRLRMMARWLGTMGEVAVQEQAVRLAGLLDRGDKAMQAQDFLAAARYYDRVAIGIRTFPYRFDWGDLPDVVQAKIFEAQAEARREDLNRLRRAREDAADRAQQERQREEALLRAKVDAILGRARRHYARQDYRRASIEAWNAYELDRRREDARRLYLDARRQSHVQFDDYIRREQPERHARLHHNIHRNMIPQSDLMVYPRNWFEINLRKPEEVGERTEEGWQRDLRERLEQEVEFVWEDTMLEDAVEFLRRHTGVNFVIAPGVYAAGGPPPITLSGRMRLRTVLNWISQITRLEYTLRSQAVYISDDITQGDNVLRIYNVNDLLSPVTDFEAPELGWSGGGGGGGFDLFGGGGGFDDAGGLDIGEIQALIEESIAPDSWNDPGIAIDIRQGGTLFINQSLEVHDMVSELLRNLRAQASLQVNVRIRALDVTRAFTEEIGINWSNAGTTMLSGTSTSGFRRNGDTWSSVLSSDNRLPSNRAENMFNTQDSGMRVETGFNLSNTFNAPQLNMVLEALHQEMDQTVLNAPELTAFNGQRANAQFINQFAYIADYNVETTGDGGTLAPEIDIINLGDIIDVKPLVSADRKYVTLEMRVSSVILRGVFKETIRTLTEIGDGLLVPLEFPIDLPNVEVQTVRTTVMLPDKGSLMLGGYTRGLRQRTRAGIPFLSHIPFLGRLFSRTGVYDENRHLMYLLTVTILDIDELERQQ